MSAASGTYFHVNCEAQRRTLLSEAPELLLSSAYGKGKSRILCEKVHLYCLRYPGAPVILARKKREHLGLTTLRTLLHEVVSEQQRAWGWRVAADGGSTLFYPNGSFIAAVGLDNPGRLRSGWFSLAAVDQCEELDEEEWNSVAGRLRSLVGPYRQLFGACNPEGPTHFLYRRFRPQLGSHVELSEREVVLPDGRVLPAGRVLRECVLSGPTDNYENLPPDYVARLQSYEGWYYDRYVAGLWTTREGAVYGFVWSPAVHVVERPASWVERWGGYPPPSWARYRAVDFGYQNPFVCLTAARDGDGRFWVYRERYMSHRLVEDHGRDVRGDEAHELETLRRCAKGRGEREPEYLNFAGSVADHDAEDRATLEKHGVPTRPAIKEVEAGIKSVIAALQPDERGVPGVVFLRDALVQKDRALARTERPTCTVEEFPGYRWPDKKPNRGEAEEPVKENDHGLDALRYLVHTVRRRGSLGIRELVGGAPPREPEELVR